MTVVLTNVIPWELIWPEEPSLLSRELVLKRRTLEFKQRHVLNHKIIQRLIVQLCMERKKSVTPIYIEMGPVRTDSLEKTLMLGKLEGKRRRWQRMRWLGSIINSMDMSLSKLREICAPFSSTYTKKVLGDDEGQRSLACCSPWGHEESDMA